MTEKEAIELKIKALCIRILYYDNINRVQSLAELKAYIRTIEHECAIENINPDIVFWTHKRFNDSKGFDLIPS
jgi:uncharacterized protein (DUF4213/DUF364 family)